MVYPNTGLNGLGIESIKAFPPVTALPLKEPLKVAAKGSTNKKSAERVRDKKSGGRAAAPAAVISPAQPVPPVQQEENTPRQLRTYPSLAEIEKNSPLILQ